MASEGDTADQLADLKARIDQLERDTASVQGQSAPPARTAPEPLSPAAKIALVAGGILYLAFVTFSFAVSPPDSLADLLALALAPPLAIAGIFYVHFKFFRWLAGLISDDS